jgi:exosortase/archaeosortase family protein
MGGGLALYVAFGASPAINVPLREATAVGTAWLLGLVGTSATGEGALLSAGSVRFAVVPDCTAVGPLLLLWAAILAFPAPLRGKLFGMAVGALALTGLNFVRLVTLVLIGMARPEALEIAHLVVWQSLMILAAIALWVAWLRRYGRVAPA